MKLNINKYLLSIIFAVLIFTILPTTTFAEGLENINQLNKSELAWSTESKELTNNNYSYEVIYEDDILKPWKLILKK